MEARRQTSLTVPGITCKDQAETVLKNLALAIIEDSYPISTWTHVYEDGSTERETKIEAAESIFSTRMEKTAILQYLLGCQLCSNYKAAVLAIVILQKQKQTKNHN